ncbi:MAG: L,D-transpeptidase family protein [Acidobacteriaceae bacterium]|nr:L,D-transpeptidase family protein [Acidobacteriaceae bacterium]
MSRQRSFVAAVVSLTTAVVFAGCSSRGASSLPLQGVDRLVVVKHEHRLSLYRGGQEVARFHVSLGRGGPGPKLQEGDKKVPEGSYLIVAHNPHSTYHNALRVGYPTPIQEAEAKARGVNPGGDIMIHGIHNGFGWLGALQGYVDWTEGCIALTDAQVDAVARAVPDGTPIVIEH